MCSGLACLPSILVNKRKGGKPLVVFATGGERGKVRIWRSDTGEVVTEQESAAGAYVGGEITCLESIAQNQYGLMTTMADNTITLWDCEVNTNKTRWHISIWVAFLFNSSSFSSCIISILVSICWGCVALFPDGWWRSSIVQQSALGWEQWWDHWPRVGRPSRRSYSYLCCHEQHLYATVWFGVNELCGHSSWPFRCNFVHCILCDREWQHLACVRYSFLSSSSIFLSVVWFVMLWLGALWLTPWFICSSWAHHSCCVRNSCSDFWWQSLQIAAICMPWNYLLTVSLGTGTGYLCETHKLVRDANDLLSMPGSKDNAIMVWDAPSGNLIATGKEHNAAVSSVALSHK